MVPDDTGWSSEDPDDQGDEWGAGRRPDDHGSRGDSSGEQRRSKRGDDRRRSRPGHGESSGGQRRPRRGEDRRGPQSRRSALDSLLDGSSTWVNALIGGLAGIVLSFVPFSTVLGGVVAGYLEAGSGGESPGASTSDGLTVGGIAGAIMFVPFLLFAYIAFAIVAASGSSTFGGLVLVVFLLAALYTIGAGMVGGVLGVIVRDEVDNRPESRRGW